MTDGQDERTRAANKDFFTHEHEWYASGVAELTTYRNIREAINREIDGVHRMLDIGNGGTFDYDTDLVRQIVAVDLFLEDLPRDTFPPNVTPRNGDALALDEPADSYDAVLIAMLLHHLSGPSAGDVAKNTKVALAEVRRVLKPGGKLILVESCVPRWFHAVEHAAYPALRRVAGTRALRHPPTLQLPARLVADLVEAEFGSCTWEKIPVGALVMQFGWRWPSALTPARAYRFVATKQ